MPHNAARPNTIRTVRPIQHVLLRGRGPNTMTVQSLDELTTFVLEHPQTPILLSGEGSAFSAGLDLDAVAQNDPVEITRAIERAARALFLHPAPTVAAINGHAIAGGCLMAQACDLRLCVQDPNLKIGMPGVALGINYPPLLLRILRYRLPAQSIDRILLAAETHGPQRALQLGLVDELVEDAVTAGQSKLEALAAHPAHAYAAAKDFLRTAIVSVPQAEQEAFESKVQAYWQGESVQARRADKAAR